MGVGFWYSTLAAISQSFNFHFKHELSEESIGYRIKGNSSYGASQFQSHKNTKHDCCFWVLCSLSSIVLWRFFNMFSSNTIEPAMIGNQCKPTWLWNTWGTLEPYLSFWTVTFAWLTVHWTRLTWWIKLDKCHQVYQKEFDKISHDLTVFIALDKPQLAIISFSIWVSVLHM